MIQFWDFNGFGGTLCPLHSSSDLQHLLHWELCWRCIENLSVDANLRASVSIPSRSPQLHRNHPKSDWSFFYMFGTIALTLPQQRTSMSLLLSFANQETQVPYRLAPQKRYKTVSTSLISWSMNQRLFLSRLKSSIGSPTSGQNLLHSFIALSNSRSARVLACETSGTFLSEKVNKVMNFDHDLFVVGRG